jgi:MoCo/4Fe-4S cofactor protein with predicted Tat translocation signal
MENTTKRYWKGVEELKNDINFVKNANREFNFDEVEEGTQRRDFLKLLGFGMAAVSLAACDAPVRKAIPYLNKPEDVEPGIPNWYASTYAEGGDYCSILVKTREGRPIKIEGNPSSSISKGGVSARVHASVLGLYDNAKLKTAQKGGSDIKWADLDKEVMAGLAKGGNIRIVSNTIISPSTEAVIANFINKYPTATHVVYDAKSASGILEANKTSFGQRVIPSYDFSKAKVIVGINADFLGTWVSPTVFAKQWAETRKIGSGKGGNKSMSRHFQFETGMTTTGASADYRSMIKPSEEGAVVAALYNKVAAALGGSAVNAAAVTVDNLDKCAKELVAAKGSAIVVSGSNDPSVQIVVNALNNLLGSYGSTIDLGNPVNYRQGDDAAMNTFINEVKAGQVNTVIFYGANPVYDHPRGAELGEALAKVSTSVSFADRADETASKCKLIAPAPHYLESWGDAEPRKGYYSLTQPTISLIFDARQAQSSLLTWAGADADYHKFLKNYWNTSILSGSGKSWVQALHDGVYEPINAGASGGTFNSGALTGIAIAKKSSGIEAYLYESVSMGTGRDANNPWLQELPDPISKVTWENTVAISAATAQKLGLEQGDIAKVTLGKGEGIELPVLIQPGQAHETVAIAIGYGRTAAGKAGNGGKNVYPFAGQGWVNDVKLEKVNSGYTLAQTQTHNTVMGRQAVVQESVLSEYVKNSKAGRFEPKIETADGAKKPHQITLWNGHEKKNHSWGMVIDLNSCTGCNACLVSCQAENNVAVVGQKEVARAREMHWIRIDRYYSSDAPHEEGFSIQGFRDMEVAAENPEVVFQPMMCQHCSNAPCETVCPVLATTHSSEGLNQMTYNRCVGTRYCANNCPYKVRRFNWFKYFENDNFDYNMNNDLGRMVLNPDVTVRSRGVIEKCSMCVQRIQAGKLTAKKEKRRPADGEIQTACSQSCPTNAITFGDMMDENTAISKMLAVEKEGRAFHVLEEINVQPQLSYLTKIRNKDEVKKKAEVVQAEHHS